MTESLF